MTQPKIRKGPKKWLAIDGEPQFVATTRTDWKATCHVLEGYIKHLETELATARGERRNAWAKLGCRCAFDENDVKTVEDAHCPYHGWQQLDAEGWDPLGVLEVQE